MPVSKTSAEIVTAAQTVAAVVSSSASPENRAAALQEARALFERVRTVYLREVLNVPVVTVEGANLSAFFTAAEIADGDVFRVAGSDDTEDDALEDAKGSAPASGDVFQRSGSAVVYVGKRTEVTGLDAALAD